MLILPAWLPQEVWNEYVKMRRKIRKPLTDYAEKLAIEKLAELKDCGYDPVSVLKESIFHSWQGLFAPKEAAKPSIVRGATEVGRGPRPEDFGIHAKPEAIARYWERERKREADRKKAG